jgi:hypothetical protein
MAHSSAVNRIPLSLSTYEVNERIRVNGEGTEEGRAYLKFVKEWVNVPLKH